MLRWIDVVVECGNDSLQGAGLHGGQWYVCGGNWTKKALRLITAASRDTFFCWFPLLTHIWNLIVDWDSVIVETKKM